MYICVLDFEATCWEDMKSLKHEIIEFPSVLIKYDDKSRLITKVAEFQEFCLPKQNKQLSDFCKNLTGITQEQVNGGSRFPEVLKRHYLWLEQSIPNFHNENVHILTFGAWDLAVAFKLELSNWGIKSVPAIYRQFINIKKEAHILYKIKHMGMASLLKYLKMTLIGRHHSGIDDCRNIVRILEEMISVGYNNFTVTYV